MQHLNTLNKTYLPGEILLSDNLNLIVNYINQLINAINELMTNDGTSIGHYEIRYKDSLSEPSPPSTGSSGLSDGWKRSVDSVVYNIWMTLCFVTADDVYGTWTKPIKISAKDGINGSFILEVYRNDSAEAVDLNYIPEVVNNDYSNPTFPPTGWTTTILPRPEGKHTWCILRTISFNENNNLVYGKWSIPFRLTGDNGKPGEDGKYLEYIYKHFTSEQTWQQTNSNPAYWSISDTSYDIESGQENHTNPLREDYIGPVDLGWTDNPQGVTDLYKYEYVCQRTYNGKSYEAFTSPVIWSKYGDKGRDGDGYEYIFKGGPTYGDHPNTINTPDPSSTGQTKDLDDFVPNGWSDDPVTLTEQLLYVWVSTRKRKGGGSWGNFSDPKIWAHWSLRGSNGGHYEFRYKNSATQPNAPTGEGTSDGWSSIPSAPDFANGVYTWMSQCFVSGEGNYGTWTTPVRITGGNGEDGADGTDIEFIYARKTEIWQDPTAPTVSDDPTIAQDDWPNVDGNTPSKTINGTTWYDNPQGVTSSEKYEYMCVRYKHAGTSTWTAYSQPVIWSAFGNKGADGDGVEYIFYADKDGRLNPDPVNYPPGWTNDTNFQTSEYIRNNSSWEDEPIDLSTASGYGPGTVQWVSMRKKQNGVWQAYSEPAVWSRLGKDGVVDGYTVDLSNENMPVGTSSDGTVSGWSNSSLIQVFHNTTPLTYDGNAGTNPAAGYFNYNIGTITRSDDPDHEASGFRADKNNDTVVVRITTVTHFNEVSATVPITIYLPGGIERELVITIFGVATGEAGQFIDMVLSSKVIRSNNTETEVSPTTVSMGIMIGETTYWSTQGSPEGSAESKGYSFKYCYDNDLLTNQVGPISVSSGHSVLTVNMYKDNYLIDSENIPFIKDGENALVIDIDNDNDLFGTDSESKVLIQQTRSTKVTMFYGTTKQRFTSVPTAVLKYDDGKTTVPSEVAKVEVSPNTANSNEYTVTLTIYKTGSGSIPLASRNGFNILITGICEQGTKTITFTVEKVMSGARGVTPIIYQLAPSLKSLTFSRNAQNNLTPPYYDVEVNVLKIEENTTTEVKSSIPDITYSYGWDTSSTAILSGLLIGSTIRVTNSNASDHNQVWIKLSTGDTETLPIVKDGTNGADGADGADGDDAEFYRLEPIIEKAIVDKDGTLGVQLAYKIQHVVGDTITDVRASSNGYHVIFKGDSESSNKQLSVNTTQPSYTNTSYMTNYHIASSKPIYFTAYLVDGSNATQDQRIITVIFAAGATLQITDQINATVQGHQTAIVNLDSELAGTQSQVVTNTNNISNINQKADGIQSTVASQQTTINELTGEVEAQTSSISQITQTANNISMMVSENSGNVLYNSDFSDLNSDNKPNDWSTVTGGSLNGGSTSNKYLGYNSWYQNYDTWHSSNPSSGTYCEMLQQTLHSTDGTINKILPDTIYELSFYAKGNGTLQTFIFPSCVDTNIKAFVDGVEQNIPVDGNIDWTLTSSYKFHRLVFRTTSTISGGQYILFRLATPDNDASNDYAYVVLPQLKGGADAGLRKTGIDIAKGTIDLRADRVKFSNSAGTVSGKVWIDSTAGTLHAVDGDFSGKIAASSGNIGGFTIGSDKLYNESFDAGIDIDTNNGMHAKIGKNAAGPMSTETAIMRAENTRSGQNYNTALYLNTSGANYNYAFYGNGNGVLDGLMFGFRTQYTQIPYESTDVTASLNLQDGSHIILYGSRTGGNVTMNMPTLGSICNCLGIPFGTAPTKSFAIEIDILNLSGYEHLYIGFRNDNAPGSSSTVLPVLFDNDGNVHYRKQLAQHDFYKVLLLYNADVKYRAYEIVYKT